MAEQQDQNRTEEATPFKLKKAREKGMVARGLDLGFVAGLIGLALFVSVAGSALVDVLAVTMRRALSVGVAAAADPHAATALAAQSLWPALSPVAVFGGTLVAVVMGVEVAQLRGLVFSPTPLKPDLNRLNPAAGFKRVYSKRMLVEAAKSVVKLLVFALIAGLTIRASVRAAQESLTDAVHLGAALQGAGLHLLLVFILIAAIFAIVDQVLSRRAFARQMRMSRHEVTREVKDREGDARLKNRRKQVHAALVEQAKGVARVRDSDMLVVNPEHVAVALAYKPTEHGAPVLTAKGAGHHAQRLRRAAVRWNVPIIRQPALARSLFSACDTDREIASEHYSRVAELYLKLEADHRA